MPGDGETARQAAKAEGNKAQSFANTSRQTGSSLAFEQLEEELEFEQLEEKLETAASVEER